MKDILFGITDLTDKLVDIDKRFEIYKRQGYDFVSVNWEYDYEENVKAVNSSIKHNLPIDDIHLRFEYTNEIWKDKTDNKYYDYVKKSIDEISEFYSTKKDVVIHITSTFNPPPFNEVGFENLKELYMYAKSKNIRLCFENLKRPDYLIMLADRLPDIDMCFDLGHAHLYIDDYYAFIEKYSKNIVTTHIHDNMKDADSHLEFYLGNIDFVNSTKALLKTNTNKLHLEIFPHYEFLSQQDFEDFTQRMLANIKDIYYKSKE